MNNGDEFKGFSVVNETLEDLPWFGTTMQERALRRIAINLAEIADQLAEKNGYIIAKRSED